MYWQLRCRASRRHDQRALSCDHPGARGRLADFAYALLRELFETCPPCRAKLQGVPSLGSPTRLAVRSLVLLVALTTSCKSLLQT